MNTRHELDSTLLRNVATVCIAALVLVYAIDSDHFKADHSA